MIKYINLISKNRVQNPKQPNMELVLVHDDGSRQYVGSIWYDFNKGFGSVKLQDGVTITASEAVKKYASKQQKTDSQTQEQPKNDISDEVREDNLKKANSAVSQISYGDEEVNPNDIPF